ncbi:hypothetical protein BV898_10105 [Hypsibius exemplaris]|uniref:Reverse transcriptase domain-containing protein n=1 Tax=Hypsibius exemplaris TaxID=2072580 RepID=A0A1W0WKI1_HYPEX|nr:hypothetical protein BV898_10105 [Hypsibius exemplaris]
MTRNLDGAESMWIVCNLDGRAVLIGVFYRPPWATAGQTEELFAHIEDVLDQHPNHNHVLTSDFSEVKVEEVLNILREITTARKSTSPSGIPPKLLGIVALLIAEPLAHLVNASFRSGVYPDIFKIAHIIPISKSTDASKPDDFRPIALINNAFKVFEKVVQSRLLEHLQRWKRTMDNGGVTAVAFLNLRKAIDSVCHTTLLHKLQAVGVDHTDLAWFHSCLTDRSQRVHTEAGLSDLLPTTSGVPQGTVLRLLLFSLYINEMLLISPADLENCEVECFADDTTIEASGKTAEEVVVRLNAGLHYINTELASLRHPTSAAKTKVIIFVPLRSTKKNHNIAPVSMGGTIIEEVSCVKHLGVLIDKHLQWDEQFKAIQRNATFGIAKFNRAKGGLSIQQRGTSGATFTDSTTKPELPIPTLEEVETLLRKGSLRIIPNPFSKSDTAFCKKIGLSQLEDSSKPLPYADYRSCQKVYTYKLSHSSGTSTLKRHLQENVR